MASNKPSGNIETISKLWQDPVKAEYDTHLAKHKQNQRHYAYGTTL
jgi:hypothetical protein